MSGSDGDRVAAAQIVILAVRTGAVAGQAADAAADANQIRVRRQHDRADVASVLHAHRFAADPDLARDARALNRASRQPARIFQIICGCLTGCAVELIHPPVIAHIPIALKLLDHLADGKLSGDTRPYVAVRIAGIHDHVRIGVPQHPADGVHGAASVNIAGIPRLDRVPVQIDNLKRAAGVVLRAGAIHGVFQTIDRLPFQIMRRGVDRAVAVELGNLLVFAVMSGTAVKVLLTGIERLHTRVVISQVKIRGRIERSRRIWEGVIRHVIIRRVGWPGFLRQHPNRRRVRPRHLSVRFFRAIQIAHQQPRSPLRILPRLFHIHVGFIDKVAVIQLAVIIVARRFVDLQIDARIRRDPNEIACLHILRFFLLQSRQFFLRNKIRQVRRRLFRQAFFLLQKLVGRFVVCRAVHHIRLRFGDVVRQTVRKFFCRFIQPAIQCFLARIGFFLPRRFFRVNAKRQRRQRHAQRKQPCPNSFCHVPSFQRSTARITSRPSLPA